MAEALGHERLADPDRTQDQHVVAGVDEAQRAQLVADRLVEGDLGGVVPVLEAHVGVEAGGPGPQRGRGGLAPGDLVGEDELQELGVAHGAGLGQREAFGEGVEAAAQLDAPQHALQLGGDVGAGAVMPHRPLWWPLCSDRHRSVSGPGLAGGRSARGAGEPGGGAVGLARRVGFGALSVARSIIRPMSGTLIGLGFQRPGAGGFDPLGTPLLHQAQQGVDLAHLGPRQRVVQQRRRVGADGGSVVGASREMVDVAQGVDGLLGRQVGGVGDRPPGRLAGMDLDSWPR